MTTQKNRIRLNSDGQSLGIAKAAWDEALKTATPDPVVKIRHAQIGGNEQYRTHVAAIPEHVGCHVHMDGDEDYAVVAGKGTLHWGAVAKNPNGNGYIVNWETPIDVETGDSFVIPEGYAHQLARRGSDDLVIVFGCPDSHMANDADRFMLPSAPELTA